MKEYLVGGHQVLTSLDGRVWVNSGVSGMTIGRFQPPSRIDVHDHEFGACEDCKEGSLSDFIDSMQRVHNVDLTFLKERL